MSRWRVGYLDGKMTAFKEVLPYLTGEKRNQIEKDMRKMETDLEKEVRESKDEAVRNYRFTRCD